MFDLGMNTKCFTQNNSAFFSVHVINDVKIRLNRSYEMVKGGEFFFSKKRWLKKGFRRMKIWV